MRIELYPASDGQWHWRIRAANHEILAHSEAYTRKQSAKKTAKIVADALNVELVDLDPRADRVETGGVVVAPDTITAPAKARPANEDTTPR